LALVLIGWGFSFAWFVVAVLVVCYRFVVVWFVVGSCGFGLFVVVVSSSG
jgi:hypothetical protein